MSRLSISCDNSYPREAWIDHAAIRNEAFDTGVASLWCVALTPVPTSPSAMLCLARAPATPTCKRLVVKYHREHGSLDILESLVIGFHLISILSNRLIVAEQSGLHAASPTGAPERHFQICSDALARVSPLAGRNPRCGQHLCCPRPATAFPP